ncbi:MAG: HD domain-containing phosphohydrolase, partial [Methylomonas sp.]
MADILNKEELLQENRQLQVRLEELEETLHAIHSGEVDALVVSTPQGDRVFTLTGALEPYRVLVETMSEGAVTLAQDGTIFWCNGRFAELVVTPHEQIIGLPLHTWIHAKEKDKFATMLAKGYAGIVREELALQTGSGQCVPVHLSMRPLPEAAVSGIVAVITDLTEVAAATAASTRMAMIVDSSDVAIVSTTLDGVVESWNKAAERLFGYSFAEAMGRPIQLLMASPEPVGDIAQKLDAVCNGGSMEEAETVQLRKDGSTIHVSTSAFPICDSLDRIVGISFILRDITERKRAEDALYRANRALRTLSAGNQSLVQAMSEAELLQSVTRVIGEEGGYSLATVDYAEDDPESSIRPMAWSIPERDYFLAERISWADKENGQVPAGRAIRSGATQICHDIAGDTGFRPWKDAALGHGYVSNIALPLSGGGRTFGALSIYSATADAFDAQEVQMLEELASDLAYGITNLRTRIEHEQHAMQLRESLEQSIQTIAGTLEARDPYTAGHQRRTAELATAIARKMGLPEEQVNGIHFASIIHDVGKIHIPAEILAKPGKLSAIEFMFIKAHPQAGYDILKHVKFPWPITDIILQHHERLDGTGYPQGLKEGQILLEAKILAVADVVEAMCSHRPYRPALGIGAALEEIERG